MITITHTCVIYDVANGSHPPYVIWFINTLISGCVPFLFSSLSYCAQSTFYFIANYSAHNFVYTKSTCTCSLLLANHLEGSVSGRHFSSVSQAENNFCR